MNRHQIATVKMLKRKAESYGSRCYRFSKMDLGNGRIYVHMYFGRKWFESFHWFSVSIGIRGGIKVHSTNMKGII